MSEQKKAAEDLIARGSWVEHFDVYKLKTIDGAVRDNVYVERADGSIYRLWVMSTYPPTQQPLARYEHMCIADWRRRGG